MKKFNVGIIGYGWAAQAHIPALNATSLGQVTAICSSRKLDGAELSARHGCPIKVYNDLDAMLADPSIHAVDVCSFHHLHVPQAIAAARAGKHLIIEKPLALNWKDCVRMADSVRKAGVKTCVCFELRWSSQFLTTKSVLDAGLLGDVHYAEVDYYHGIGPWYREYEWITTRKACGSGLLEAGCHAMDAMLLCMGGEVESVFAEPAQSKHKVFQKYEYPTTTVTLVRFKDGRVGKVASVIDCWQPYYFHTHLVGSEGSLLDDKFHSNKLHLDKTGWSKLSMKLCDSGDVGDHPYKTQFEAFFEALDKDAEMPLTNLNEAMKTHAVVFAADKSAATGKPVKLKI